jgi:radical SAM protein with 4Fe4S-binding SPASM domain
MSPLLEKYETDTKIFSYYHFRNYCQEVSVALKVPLFSASWLYLNVDLPSFVQVYPTVRCNHQCTFCFNNAIPGKSSLKDMSFLDAVALAETLVGCGIKEIDVMGGEPLSLPWMTDFAEYATGIGIALNISTNGSFPSQIEGLCAIDNPLLRVGFSIHGLRETHNGMTRSGSFDSAVEGICKAVTKGRNPIVKSVLTPFNVHEMEELVDFIRSHGVSDYFILHEDIIGFPENVRSFSFPRFMQRFDELKHLYPEMEINFVAASGFQGGAGKTRCAAGTKKIAVLPDGSVYPCNLFFPFPQFTLGNVFTESLETIVKNPLLHDFRLPAKTPLCSIECVCSDRCSGGCPAHSYFFSRRLDLPDPRCATHRNRNSKRRPY